MEVDPQVIRGGRVGDGEVVEGSSLKHMMFDL